MKTTFLISTIFLCLSQLIHAEKLTIYTEEAPPYNYTENGKIIGFSPDVMRAVLAKTDFDYEIISLPWARAYKLSQKKPNTLLFSISRRVNREKLFKWLGIIAPVTHSVYVLRSRTDIQLKKLSDLKKYSIASTVEDARESYLLNQGFTLADFDRLSGEDAYQLNYKKLLAGRVDLWPMPDLMAAHILSKDGKSLAKTLRKAYYFKEFSKGGYYVVASPTTSDKISNKISRHLEEFKKTDDYQKILKKWLGE